MKLSEFILLNEGDKKIAVMNNAVALAQRTYPKDTNAIEHYLDAIQIDDLLN